MNIFLLILVSFFASPSFAALNPFVGKWVFADCGEDRPFTYMRRIVEFKASVLGDPSQGIAYESTQYFGNDTCTYKFAAPFVRKGSYNIEGNLLYLSIFDDQLKLERKEIYKFEAVKNGIFLRVVHEGIEAYGKKYRYEDNLNFFTISPATGQQ